MFAEKGTDLKGKRLFRPRWITIESLANVKGMGVILHGLCPVPINSEQYSFTVHAFSGNCNRVDRELIFVKAEV